MLIKTPQKNAAPKSILSNTPEQIDRRALEVNGNKLKIT
jgi:hypothetical protein